MVVELKHVFTNPGVEVSGTIFDGRSGRYIKGSPVDVVEQTNLCPVVKGR